MILFYSAENTWDFCHSPLFPAPPPPFCSSPPVSHLGPPPSCLLACLPCWIRAAAIQSRERGVGRWRAGSRPIGGIYSQNPAPQGEGGRAGGRVCRVAESLLVSDHRPAGLFASSPKLPPLVLLPLLGCSALAPAMARGGSRRRPVQCRRTKKWPRRVLQRRCQVLRGRRSSAPSSQCRFISRKMFATLGDSRGRILKSCGTRTRRHQSAQSQRL